MTQEVDTPQTETAVARVQVETPTPVAIDSYEAKKADMPLKANNKAFDIREEKGAFSVYQADDVTRTIKYVDAFKTHNMARKFVARRLEVSNGTE